MGGGTNQADKDEDYGSKLMQQGAGHLVFVYKVDLFQHAPEARTQLQPVDFHPHTPHSAAPPRALSTMHLRN